VPRKSNIGKKISALSAMWLKRGGQVDDQIELGRLHHWQIAGEQHCRDGWTADEVIE
jgi:hypothetical protein